MVTVNINPELENNSKWEAIEGDIGDAIIDLLRKKLRDDFVGTTVKVESPGYKRAKSVTAPTTRKRKPKPTTS